MLGQSKKWNLIKDIINNKTGFEFEYDGSVEIEKKYYFSYSGCMSGYVNEEDPSDVSMESTYKAIFEGNFSTVESESKTKVTSDSNAYHFYTSLNVIQNGKPYYNKTWLKTFPRILT